MDRSDVAAVVIGRNEGRRLEHCLASVARLPLVYVDSGSDDGSAAYARAAGVDVIELDPEGGFTAARARNAGLRRVLADPAIRYVQMIDGDCSLDPHWIASGTAALDADPGLAAVFGRRREARPGQSIYLWLCDVEWDVPPGPAAGFGGDALLRAGAVRQTRGYRETMIAGEDHELSIRMRQAGWRIACLPAGMTLHDAAITRFGQWWRRSARAGHAFAELAALHPRSPLHDARRSCRRILFWGGAMPLLLMTGGMLALMAGRAWALLAALALSLTVAQIARVAIRSGQRYPPMRALALSGLLALGKYAEFTGLIRYHLNRLRGRRSGLIEYKSGSRP